MAPYRFGLLELSPDERVVRRAGTAVPLAPKAVDLLIELVEHVGEVVDKRTLLDRVWPESYVDEANLTQTIYVLRAFLKEQSCGLAIDNVPKRGYALRFNVPDVPVAEARASEPVVFARAFAAVIVLMTAFFAVTHRAPGTLDAKTMSAYLLAKQYQLRGSLASLQRSDALYAQVAAAYPQSALGFAGRSQTAASLAFYARSASDRTQMQGLATAYADAAQRRDSQSAATDTALGAVQMSVQHDDAAASRSFARALARNPDELSALAWQGSLLLNRGRIAEARRLFARAVSLAPDVPGTRASLAWTDYLLGDYAEAIAFSEQMLRANVLVPIARLTLANAFIERREFGVADAVIADLAAHRGTRLQAASLAARLDALRGRSRAAIGGLARAERTTDIDSTDDWDASAMAAAYVALGDARAAYVWLARVSPGERQQIAHDPRFSALARTSRFRTWVED